MVNAPSSHVRQRLRPGGAKVHDRADLPLITPEAEPPVMLAKVLEAHDVSQEPRRRFRVEHIEKHPMEGAYGELRGNVGMNGLAGKDAGDKAVAHCREGKGPYILEIKTYRYRGHSMSDPAKYRTREEVQKMREERDPIEQVRGMLLKAEVGEDKLKEIDKEIKEIVNASADFSKESPEPALEELWTDIYADEIPQEVN